jgi:hypothetical protein
MVTETEELAALTGLDQLMPGMGAYMAAMAYILHEACDGESKDCQCGVCVRIRDIASSAISAMGEIL